MRTKWCFYVLMGVTFILGCKDQVQKKSEAVAAEINSRDSTVAEREAAQNLNNEPRKGVALPEHQLTPTQSIASEPATPPKAVAAPEMDVVEIKFLVAVTEKYEGKRVISSGYAYPVGQQPDNLRRIGLQDVPGKLVDNIVNGIATKTIVVDFEEDFPSGLLKEKVTVSGVVTVDKLPNATKAVTFLKEAKLHLP